MRITISCGGKWCTFYQAEQLHRRGALDRIITGYPLFKLRRERRMVPEDKILSLPLPQIGSRLARKAISSNRVPVEYWAARAFDAMAARRLGECDIFWGWASYCLESMRAAKARGAMTVLERGSAHIVYQKELVEDEYERWGMKRGFADPGTVERSLKEYEGADYIVLQSEFARRSFIAKGVSEERLIKIPLGVDMKDFKQVSKEDGVFRVIYVGTLSLQKGIPYLLEAVSGLRLKDFELLLVGGVMDEIKPFLERYEGKYRYIGKVPHKELYNVYSQSSVFVLPSVQDGFGQVIPEAMSCGLPAIATENTGGPDIIREGEDGFVVPIRNPAALREKILLLYENEGMRLKMGASARARAKEFTWEMWGERTLNCCDGILSRRPGNVAG